MPITEAYDRLMNTELFRIATTEIYNTTIPKYYRGPVKSQLPVLNGHRVSWEEYLEARPDAERPEEFTPDLVYSPEEQNMVESNVPLSVIIDIIESNVDIAIANPDTAYPRMLTILNGYLELSQLMGKTNPRMEAYAGKVERAIRIISGNYDQHQARKRFKLGQDPDAGLSDFERISKIFS